MLTEIKDGWHIDISKVVHFSINLDELKGEYLLDGQGYACSCTAEAAIQLQNKLREYEKDLLEIRKLAIDKAKSSTNAASINAIDKRLSELKGQLLAENSRQK